MTEGTRPNRPPALPDEARDVYQLIIKGEQVTPDTTGLGFLLNLGLVTADPADSAAYVVTDLRQAETQLRAQTEAKIESAVTALAGMPALFDELALELLRHGRTGSSSTASEFLDGVDLVNQRIGEAIIQAREELLTSQPGPRSRRLLSKSVERDMAAVERGVAMRTLYHASARTNPATRTWAQMMTERGARVRTLAAPFMRFVLVDRASAVIQDYADGRDSRTGAWLIRDHALCGFIGEVFDQYWARADCWEGAEASAGGAITTQLQRMILRELCEGRDQSQVAKRLGYSQRTITTHLTELRKKLGLRTLHQLVYWWATSDERTLS